MPSNILLNLVAIICEVYRDDVVVHGQAEAEYLDNLKQVFDRLRKYNLTLNPYKCIFGVHRIEYVGNVIDSTGLSYTRKKLDSVYNFVKPQTQNK